MLNVACCNQPVQEMIESTLWSRNHVVYTTLSHLVGNYFLCMLETASVFRLLEIAKTIDW